MAGHDKEGHPVITVRFGKKELLAAETKMQVLVGEPACGVVCLAIHAVLCCSCCCSFWSARCSYCQLTRSS